MNSANGKKHINYLDILRIIAAFFVVFMHTSAGALSDGIVGSCDWMVLSVFTSLAFCAVPLFFMISGYLLTKSDSAADPSVLFKHRLPRIIIPLSFWTLLYSIAGSCSEGHFLKSLFIKKLIYATHGAVNISLWFLYTLIVIYIISPILCQWLKSLGEKGEKSVLVLILSIQIIASLAVLFPNFFDQFFDHVVLKKIFTFICNLSCFVLGWFLGKTKRHFSVKYLLTGIVLLWVIISVGTIVASQKAGAYDSRFQTQSALLETALGSLIFLFLKESVSELSAKSERRIEYVGRLTFPVYLMHNLWLTIIFRYISFTAWYSAVILSLTVFSVSMLISFALSSVPVVGYITCGIKRIGN